ncbi:hypothetical protein SAMN03159341_12927 [Paenibacillus sp. 1_12]|uniref:hypothetical protein n=1 Tax=Paenibacillus sp. 1_12 TaxID=1566278 RepID=UPI0008F0BFDA|nr:hypothetical protein [Paenibacillus sp. 1_12]SFM37548.1 hypothetical protein SAMN03159341_12927 [Paenibacillus sp. 1_12]
MDVFMNMNLLKYGYKFLLENKGIQKMFKDMDRLNKEMELVKKQSKKIKETKGRK